MNGNGTPDLVTRSTFGSLLRVMVNDGGGGFVFGPTLSLNFAAPINGTTGADMNGDQKAELIVFSGPSVLVMPTQSNGDIVSKSYYATTGNVSSFVTADFNNDGRPDIATSNVSTNTVNVLLNQCLP
jgi:hypothetical protein